MVTFKYGVLEVPSRRFCRVNLALDYQVSNETLIQTFILRSRIVFRAQVCRPYGAICHADKQR